MIWAPTSELIGRRWPLILGIGGCSIFTIGSATANDVQTLIICRFFAGVFGASPLCVAPAVLADVYTDAPRGVAVAIYALAVLGGPLLAPTFGGFMATSYLGWRWTLYLPAILGFVDTILLVIFCEETYHPVALANKAAAIRQNSGNWGIHAPQERMELDVHAIVRKYFTRPLRLLVTESIILVVSIYTSFIYGLVYALVAAYPYVFQTVHKMEPGMSGLPILGVFVGVCLGVTFALIQSRVYAKKLKANNNIAIPEWRLFQAIFGAPAFACGLFW